jgi:hypothetical protein
MCRIKPNSSTREILGSTGRKGWTAHSAVWRWVPVSDKKGLSFDAREGYIIARNQGNEEGENRYGELLTVKGT